MLKTTDNIRWTAVSTDFRPLMTGQ